MISISILLSNTCWQKCYVGKQISTKGKEKRGGRRETWKAHNVLNMPYLLEHLGAKKSNGNLQNGFKCQLSWTESLKIKMLENSPQNLLNLLSSSTKYIGNCFQGASHLNSLDLYKRPKYASSKYETGYIFLFMPSAHFLPGKTEVNHWKQVYSYISWIWHQKSLFSKPN